MRRLLWIGVGVVLATAVAVVAWPRERREVTTRSKEAYHDYLQGRELTERWDHLAARDAYLKAVSADSTFAMAYLGLARTYNTLRWMKERDDALARAARLSKGCTELECLLIAEGKAEMDGDHKATNAALDDLLKKYPENPETMMLQATRLWRDERKLDEAAALLQKALAADPTRVTIHNLMGYVEMERGNFDAAVASLQRYAYYAPNQPNPHDSLGEIYLKAGRYEEAIAQYLEALRIQPEFTNSALMLAQVLATTGQYKQGHLVLDTAHEVFSHIKQDRQWELAQISVDLDAKRYEDVLTRTQKFLPFPSAPDLAFLALEPRIYAMRAYSQMELAKFDDAAASLDAYDSFWALLEKSKPGYVGKQDSGDIALSSKLLRARLLSLTGKHDQATELAIAAFKNSDKPDKDLVYYYAAVAQVELQGGANQTAVELAKKVIAVIPTNPTANRVLGLALAKLGDNDGALSALTTYLHVMRAADPGNKDLDEAKAVYDRLLASS
jgi:tetratricopeptide (TPR) repeat protein